MCRFDPHYLKPREPRDNELPPDTETMARIYMEFEGGHGSAHVSKDISDESLEAVRAVMKAAYDQLGEIEWTTPEPEYLPPYPQAIIDFEYSLEGFEDECRRIALVKAGGYDVADMTREEVKEAYARLEDTH